MIRSLYDWTMSLAERKEALWFLALIAFIESSVFPIPPDILLIPLLIARPKQALLIWFVITVASVLGGYGGYLIGAMFFESVGKWVLELYGKLDKFESFSDMYNEQGAWIVFFAGITPFPYKVITIASGVTKLDPVTFGVASVLARGLRFGIICALLYFFGAPIRAFIEKNLGWLSVVFFVLLIGGFALLKYI